MPHSQSRENPPPRIRMIQRATSMDDTAIATLIVQDPLLVPPTENIADRILVADDHPVSLHLLERHLSDWGFQVETATDGEQALEILESDSVPPLAIIDWSMPKMDGVTVCSRVREKADRPYTYMLLLTGRNKSVELMTGLASGADDYVTKPYDPDELRARIRVGQRVVALERTLQRKVAQMEDALAHVRMLKGLLPICKYCKRIRDDQSYWLGVEQYIHDAVGADFSHGVCPDCLTEFYRSLGLPNPALSVKPNP